MRHAPEGWIARNKARYDSLTKAEQEQLSEPETIWAVIWDNGETPPSRTFYETAAEARERSRQDKEILGYEAAIIEYKLKERHRQLFRRCSGGGGTNIIFEEQSIMVGPDEYWFCRDCGEEWT